MGAKQVTAGLKFSEQSFEVNIEAQCLGSRVKACAVDEERGPA
jgi:hypothetical protein